MSAGDRIRVNAQLFIPRSELTFRASRGGGPGGQHVNTSATRVELTWSIPDSPSLTASQRQRLLEKLATRLDGRGVLRLVEGGRRSQHQNREALIERFAVIVSAALRVMRPRRRTKPPASAREERMRAKKRRGEQKRLRSRPAGDE